MANTFIYPFYRDVHASSYYGNVLTFPVGSNQTLKWNTTFTGYYVGLYHQLLNSHGGSGVEVARIHVFGNDEGSGVQQLEWEVDTVGTSLTDSPIYFFWVNPGSSGIPSPYFNMTQPGSSTTEAVSSATSSTSTTTSTSSASTIQTTPSGTHAPYVGTNSASSVISTLSTASVASASSPTPVTDTTAPPSSPSSSSSITLTLGVGLGVGIPLLLIVGISLGIFAMKKRRDRAGNNFSFRNSRLYRSPRFNYSPRAMHGPQYYESADHVKYREWSSMQNKYAKPYVGICEAPEKDRTPVELATGPI